MSKTTIQSLLRAIQKKCKECCCGQKQEIIECPIRDCALWHYRNTIVSEEAPKVVGDLFQRTFEEIHKKK